MSFADALREQLRRLVGASTVGALDRAAAPPALRDRSPAGPPARRSAATRSGSVTTSAPACGISSSDSAARRGEPSLGDDGGRSSASGAMQSAIQDIHPRIEISTRLAPNSPTIAPEAFSMPDCLPGGLGRSKALNRFSGIDRVQAVRFDFVPEEAQDGCQT